jgi:transposase
MWYAASMNTTDARKLNQQAQYELRKQVVRLREKGMSNKAISEIVGLSECHISTIWKKFQRGGLDAIKPGVRGRRHGEQRELNAEQEAGIKKLLVDKTPDQMKLAFALWTRDAVRLAIKQIYGIELPLRTITDYLKRWGFTPQKPTKRAYEQNPKAVAQWQETVYPQIQARAKQEKAEIHWGDETGIQNDAYNAKGFAPKGKTPIVRINATKSRINMISSITNQGKVRFMLYKETMTSQVLIKFMSRLVKDSPRKVFLILDNLRVHHSKVVKAWLEENKEQIEVIYLPSYSPELNPDEYLNGDLKHNIRSGVPARSEKELAKKTRSFMRKLQNRPKHVRNYFRHPIIAYAA